MLVTLGNVLFLPQEVKSMSKYSSGEIAAMCSVSVRTVQYYDRQNLLKPSEISEGGRRLYTDEDVKKLRLICMFRSLGLSLNCIKEIVENGNANEILLTLLEEQEKLLSGEIFELQKKKDAVTSVKKDIEECGFLTVNSSVDIEHRMKSKKSLKKLHAVILTIGIVMDLLEIMGLIHWIRTGDFVPFAVIFLIVIALGIVLTALYYKGVVYICPHCKELFRPPLKSFLFSPHTPKTRKLTCPKCGVKDFCIETSAEKDSTETDR